MRTEYRAAKLEFRAEGREVSGLALPFDTETELQPGFREKFLPGAFRDLSDVILFHEHRGPALARTPRSLTVEARAAGLHLRANLPETRAADDAIALIDAGVLQGLSVEFRAVEDDFQGGLRIIKTAELSGVAIVPRPAYAEATVAVRELWPKDAPQQRIPLWLL